MPDPYTITINFTQEDINNTPDTYDLIFVFTVNLNAANQVHTSASKNLIIKHHGSLDWDFDLEDSLLMPGDLTLLIADQDEYLAGLLFGLSSEQAATEKDFKVEIKVNGTTDFLGDVVDDEIEFNHATKILSFRSIPKTDLINKTAIYDDEGLPLDPLSQSSGASVTVTAAVRRAAPNNDEVDITHTSNTNFNTNDEIVITGVVGMVDLNRAHVVLSEVSNTVTRIALNTDQIYISDGIQVKNDFANDEKIETILEKIFQLVDSSITVASGKLDLSGPKWKLNIELLAARTISAAAVDTPTAGKVRITVNSSSGIIATDSIHIYDVVGLTELNDEFVVDNIPDGTHIDVVLATSQTYTSGGRLQLINEVSWDSNVRILEVPVWDSSDDTPATIGDFLRSFARDWFCYAGMIHREKAFFKRMYEYDSSNKQTLGEVLEKKTSYRLGTIDYAKVSPKASSISVYFDAGVFSNLIHKSFKITDTIPFFWQDIGGSGSSNVTHGATPDTVFEAKDDILDGSGQTSWLSHGQLLADLFFDARGTISKNREVQFTAFGVGYDPLKSVDHESEGFWLVGLNKNFEIGVSKLKCIFIEAT